MFIQQDDGTVSGLYLLRQKKDLIRRGVDAALHFMRPPVDPMHVAVAFHPVYVLSLGQHVPLRDVYVVTVYVPKGSAAFYTNSTGQAFVRREGSVHVMTPELIRERVTAEFKAQTVRLRFFWLCLLALSFGCLYTFRVAGTGPGGAQGRAAAIDTRHDQAAHCRDQPGHREPQDLVGEHDDDDDKQFRFRDNGNQRATKDRATVRRQRCQGENSVEACCLGVCLDR